MILEMDCGNSFIKWRALDAGVAVGGGVVDSDAALLAAVLAIPGLNITHCRLVSVRSDDETSSLVASIVTTFGVAAQCAQPARSAAGVSNGYEEFARLGLDRWLAVVGAFELAKSACLVLDFGTAVTADFDAADGGRECPGFDGGGCDEYRWLWEDGCVYC